MKKQKILYSISTEDVTNFSDQEDIAFTEMDLSFIGDKIGDYFGDKWQDAIQYALQELKKKKSE